MTIRLTRNGHWRAALCAGLLLAAGARFGDVRAEPDAGAGLASAWQQAQMSQVRLLAGREASGDKRIIAGLEIKLEDGWKTYWRSPGDAGGVPPELDWSASENVEKTKLLYPAPKRFKDTSGETVGYKGAVVLPVVVQPEDPSRPVALKAEFSFGVCREICIPVTAELDLTMAPDVKAGLPQELAAALTRTPRSGNAVRPGDPKLVGHDVVLDGPKPRIVLNVDFGPEAQAGDVLAEASDGVYLPMPKKAKHSGTKASRFEIDLLAANDPAELKGKTVRVTMIGPRGQSEASFVID